MAIEADDLSLALLLKEIDRKRERMITTAMANGFTNAETIACSQELDILINQYQIKVKGLEKSKKVCNTINSIYTFLMKKPLKISNDLNDI